MHSVRIASHSSFGRPSIRLLTLIQARLVEPSFHPSHHAVASVVWAAKGLAVWVIPILPAR
jgi:hypothetical protein